MNYTLIGYISDQKKLKEHIFVEGSNYIQMIKQKVIIFNQIDSQLETKGDKRFKSISYKLTSGIKLKNLYVANNREKQLDEVLKETIPNLKDCLIVVNGTIDFELFQFLKSYQKQNNIDYLFNNNLIFSDEKSEIFKPENSNVSGYSIINYEPLTKVNYETLINNLDELDGLGIFIVFELSRLHFEKFKSLSKGNKELRPATKDYFKPIYYYQNCIIINSTVYENFINEILQKHDFIKFNSEELIEMFKINEQEKISD